MDTDKDNDLEKGKDFNKRKGEEAKRKGKAKK